MGVRVRPMALSFQSLRSGSSGNCLVLTSARTTLLIDAGFPSIRGCREALEELLPTVDGVVISHLHGDHVSYSSLRVIEEHGLPVYVFEGDLRRLARRHFKGMGFHGLDLRPFAERQFRVGDFFICPFEVPHYPSEPTFGFEVHCTDGGRTHRAVLATDFFDWEPLRGWFENADFLYVEANYDPDLLRLYWNPNSAYHLSNGECGKLLGCAFERSRSLPAAVMLGHLSNDRNRPDLARDTVGQILGRAGYGRIRLRVAPRFEPSDPIHIA